MKKKKIILVLMFVLIVVCFISFLYLNDYYNSTIEVNNYVKNNDEIIITKIKDGYFIDGESSENAIIFYPGGKVEAESYIPLLYQLSLNGFDCFLLEVPFNLAILNINKADNIINNYEYNNWYVGGHSLGGAVSTMYANNNFEKIKGIILLAAYPTSNIPENLKVLSIYGSKDGVLNIKKYNESKKYWNSNVKEVIIEGANHAQYGNYGHQKGDNESTITLEEQQNKTVDEIVKFILGIE